MPTNVCVIIPAYNAEDTIGRAIGSALAQPEVAEVIVIDDASNDSTAGAAARADDGSGRLEIVRAERNLGPAAARNLAIERGTAPMIALLDADDYLLPGRFDALDLDTGGWDLVADNILFVPEDGRTSPDVPILHSRTGAVETLDLATFVAGNVGKGGRTRGELGFLKPVMRRAFLVRHGLSYDNRLRLGEDFDLYARMLARGASFGLTSDCYYVAVERRLSLSARHPTNDLASLLAGIDRLSISLDGSGRSALRPVRNQVSARLNLRRFLDDKRDMGLARTMLAHSRAPMDLANILLRVGKDKLDLFSKRRDSGQRPRLLIAVD